MGNIFVLCTPGAQTNVVSDEVVPAKSVAQTNSTSSSSAKKPADEPKELSQEQPLADEEESQEPIFSAGETAAAESDSLMNVEEAIGVKPVSPPPSKHVEEKKAEPVIDYFADMEPEIKKAPTVNVPSRAAESPSHSLQLNADEMTEEESAAADSVW